MSRSKNNITMASQVVIDDDIFDKLRFVNNESLTKRKLIDNEIYMDPVPPAGRGRMENTWSSGH